MKDFYNKFEEIVFINKKGNRCYATFSVGPLLIDEERVPEKSEEVFDDFEEFFDYATNRNKKNDFFYPLRHHKNYIIMETDKYFDVINITSKKFANVIVYTSFKKSPLSFSALSEKALREDFIEYLKERGLGLIDTK